MTTTPTLRRTAKGMVDRPGTLRVLDRLTTTALRAAAPPFLFFSRLGPARLPGASASLKRMGLFPLRDHYYQPMFNDAHLVRPLSEPRDLPGIDWRHEEQVAWLGELERYAGELRELHLDRPAATDLDYTIVNPGFESGDAEVLYATIRRTRPRRVVEIGSGHSTKVARMALRRNESEDGVAARHVCVEPYEQPWLEQLGVEVVRRRVEQAGLDLFTSLEAGDLLFIDSSHVIRPQGDVLFEFLEVLPRLAPGVLVHVHDIFSPRDYLDEWVRRDVLMWNEQYLLEALLAHSGRYEVVAANNHLKHTAYDRLSAVCPYLTPDREPGSFWLRVRGD